MGANRRDEEGRELSVGPAARRGEPRARTTEPTQRKTRTTVYTVGFTGTTIEAVVAALHLAGVERVIDVRARAGARGRHYMKFNKHRLAGALTEAGIEYLHLPSAGNPHRSAPPADRIRLFVRDIEAFTDVIDQLGVLVAAKPSALLCREAHAHECHRGVLADRIAARRPQIHVVHLEPAREGDGHVVGRVPHAR